MDGVLLYVHPSPLELAVLNSTSDSWGPPGNPYEGGPGDGQWDSSNSGSDGGTLVFQSAAAYLQQLSPAISAAVCFLVLAMFL